MFQKNYSTPNQNKLFNKNQNLDSRISTPVILKPNNSKLGERQEHRDYRRERENIIRGRRAVSVNNRVGRARSKDLLGRLVTKDDIRGQSSGKRRNSFRADVEVFSPQISFKKSGFIFLK